MIEVDFFVFSMTLRIFYRWTEMIENAQAFPKALRNFANSLGMLQYRLEFFSNEICKNLQMKICFAS